MSTHHNCRCVQIPRPAERLAVQPGEVRRGVALFERLTDAQQRRILGPAKYRAYKVGSLTLEDLRGFGRGRYGRRIGYERSLRNVLGDDLARAFRAA